MLAKSMAAEYFSQLHALGQTRRQFGQDSLVAVGHVQPGGAHQVVEDQQTIQDDALWIGVLRVHAVQCFGHIAEGLHLLRRRTQRRQAGVQRQGLGRHLGMSEKKNVPVGRQRTLIVTPNRQQRVELRTLVPGIQAKADENQLFVRMRVWWVNNRKLRHGNMVQNRRGDATPIAIYRASDSQQPAASNIIYLSDMGNTFKTALLLTALTLFLLLMGQIFGGQRGMELALGLAVVMNFASYFFSDKIALAMYRAQPVTREQLPRAYEVVERLTQKMGIPMPKIYVIPTDSPNAFATGRNPQHASVAVTEGILNLLNDEELEGVLAHELGHVRNRDILISSVAATLAGAITLLARMGYWASLFGGMGGRDDRDRGGGFAGLLMLILAPIAATLIQLAVSRSREYQADATGAQLTGNPYALASALKKLDAYSKRIPMQASPSTAHLFIVAPLLSGVSFANLFSTHPPIAKRIERLTGRPAQLDY